MKILLFLGNSVNSIYVANAVLTSFNDVKIIVEEPPSKYILVRRRIKKLGLGIVFGQMLFMLFEKLALSPLSKNRILQLREKCHLKTTPVDKGIILNVSSINDVSVIEKVERFKPDIIVVNGTRIIAKKIIDKISVPMINIHVGITPQYRGVHGAYWALYNNDTQNCGVTIHMIDHGIDTGTVILQKRISPEAKDNFTTYPTLQYGEIIPELVNFLYKFNKSRTVETLEVNPRISNLYSHPTISQYVRGLFRGVK